MKLRQLMLKDAAFMLEWMHDFEVVKDLYTNFSSMTINDCYRFIQNSHLDKNNLHLAIVDENDEYLGTVSLKHIDKTDKTAEFAITVRRSKMGTGIAAIAMRDVLQIGLQKEKLKRIFWCVNRDNIRAIRFYNKNGYQTTYNIPNRIKNNYEQSLSNKLIWYFFEGQW